jgi:hypothetical protein
MAIIKDIARKLPLILVHIWSQINKKVWLSFLKTGKLLLYFLEEAFIVSKTSTGPCNELSHKIIIKSAQLFLKRRFLKLQPIRSFFS